MLLTVQIAKHFREIHFGGNWTCSNIKDNLSDVTWQEATTQVYNLNTIATLAFHIHYYVAAVLKVFQGEPLNAHDTYSFAHPPINSQEDWDNLLKKMWLDAEQFAMLTEQQPDGKMWEHFTDEKYGSYYRNLHGIIEHSHYHLGQIALIKKILRHNKA
jgi:hypothetical protein